MGDKSKIEWTDATWNPVRGCTKVSPECLNCYAMRQAHRQSGPGGAYEGLTRLGSRGPEWTGRIRLVPELLEQPLRWRRPRRVFVDSMSDLFHPDVPDEFIVRVYAVMALAGHHTFQVLTKRPHHALEWSQYAEDLVREEAARIAGEMSPCGEEHAWQLPWPLRNVWLGTSVGNQPAADARIPDLLRTPAAVRFLSCEPLLGPVDLSSYLEFVAGVEGCLDSANPLHWVIVGGESGPRARLMHPDWARSLRDQCQDAGVPFFFKQWGEWAPICDVYDDDIDVEVFAYYGEDIVALEPAGFTPQGENRDSTYWCDYQPCPGSWWMYRAGKKAAGRLLDGREWNELPEAARA